MSLGINILRSAISSLLCIPSFCAIVSAQPLAAQVDLPSAFEGASHFVQTEVLLVTLQVPLETPPPASELNGPSDVDVDESEMAKELAPKLDDNPLVLEPIFVAYEPEQFDATSDVEAMPTMQDVPTATLTTGTEIGQLLTMAEAVETVGCTSSSPSGFELSPCNACDRSVLLAPLTPTLTVSVDSLLFNRSGGDTRDAVFQSNVRANRNRTPDQFGDWGFGPRLQLSRESNNGGWDFGGSIWFLDGWNRKTQFDGDHSAVGVDVGVGSSRANYQSDLASFDVNMKKYVTNWTRVVVGLRWMELDEQANVRSTGTNVALLNRQVKLDNRLLGGQIGLDHTIWDRGGRLTVDVNTRIGILANDVSRSDLGFGSNRLTADSTSLLGEVEFAGTYQISPRWSATFGYHVMGISDVAFAIDQFSTPLEVHNTGELFVNGFRAGLGLTW